MAQPTAAENEPVAVVRCYSPNGTPTTVVTCYSPIAILNAAARVNPADTVLVQRPRGGQ
jgi:hypothetical protein